MQQHFLKKLINKITFYILKKPHFEFVFFLFWGKKSGNSSWCCSLVTDFLESLVVRHSHTELLMEWQHLSVSSYLDRFHLQEKSKKERKGSKDTVRSKDASSIRSKGNVLHTNESIFPFLISFAWSICNEHLLIWPFLSACSFCSCLLRVQERLRSGSSKKKHGSNGSLTDKTRQSLPSATTYLLYVYDRI